MAKCNEPGCLAFGKPTGNDGCALEACPHRLMKMGDTPDEWEAAAARMEAGRANDPQAKLLALMLRKMAAMQRRIDTLESHSKAKG